MAITPGLTLDQFLQRQETEPASEFACGEAFQKPMPNRHHAAIQLFLAAILYQFLSGHNLGRGFTELRCIFGPSRRERIYVPDLVFVSFGRLTADLHLHTAPDLAVEILSPDDHVARLLDKVQFYLLYGVKTVWIVDLATRTVTVEVPGAEARILDVAATLDGGDVLPGFTLPIRDIFAQMEL